MDTIPLQPFLLKDDGSPVEYVSDAIVEKCIHSYVGIDIGVQEVKKELYRTIVSYLSFLLADMQASRLTTKRKLPTDDGKYGTPQPHPRVMVDSQNKDR